MSKKKILFVALAMFLMTMMSILYIIGEENFDVHKQSLQTSILNNNQTNKNLNEKDYRKLLNNTDDEFIIVNTDRTFRFVSSKLLTIHDYTVENILEVNVLTFIHPKDLPAFSNLLIEFHKELKIMNNVGPIRIKTKSGEYINYLVNLIPFTDKQGQRTGTGVILKNIQKPLGDK
ncbi:PAS domain S-box protein [Candidatus Peregrinibacteria bacterium]|nr:PAS domain S-box protein [Candidatus Peregrinibacteria bacterium]